MSNANLQDQESLKNYRDIKNIVETSKEEGREEGKLEERYNMAGIMTKNGEPTDKIMVYTGLSKEEIEKL